MRFDFSDLRLFEAAVRLGSISAGARCCNLALASASARISGMEASLGTKLLRRGRRGVATTAAGQALLSHAQSILAQIENMRGDLLTYAGGLKGDIRVLSNTAGLVEIIPAALKRFLTMNPNVDVDVEETKSTDIVNSISEGHAEFGLVAGRPESSDLEVILLGIDRLVAIVGVDTSLASSETLNFSQLLSEPFVGITKSALSDHLVYQASRLGRRISYRVRLRSLDGMLSMVEAGIGAAVVPELWAKRQLPASVRMIELTEAWTRRELFLCAQNFSELSPHARGLIDIIKRISCEIIPQS